jgi:SanA protein
MLLSRIKKFIYLIIKASILLFIVVIVLIYFCNTLVEQKSSLLLYNSIDSVPYNNAGLVMGTSKYLRNGNLNYYFYYRIDAAEKLFKSGKIKFIIVSGDNRKASYNEPRMMRAELIKRGIPKEAIILDFAGFRTLDSVVRSKEIFGQDSITVISQAFQNERAIYVAKYYGISAIGFNAKDVNFQAGFKTQLRELLARVKLMLDVHITNKQPRFLGERIAVK